MLWMFQRVNYGTVTNPKNRGLRDLSPREWFVIAPICAMCIVMGVVPGVFLKPMEPAVKKTVEHVRGSGMPMSTERIEPAKPAVVALVPAPPPGAAPPVSAAAKEAHR
jgi:NADH-quinone oxidoreductase subunit M